jgi:hypothetical protein
MPHFLPFPLLSRQNLPATADSRFPLFRQSPDPKLFRLTAQNSIRLACEDQPRTGHTLQSAPATEVHKTTKANQRMG